MMGSSFNYRKFYAEETNTSIPIDFDIHHLDFNRENNSIDNLVAIPKDLHVKFHQAYYDIIPYLEHGLKPGMPMASNTVGYGYLEYSLFLLNKYSDVKVQVSKWIDYKCYLLGIMPNIHNLKY